MMKNFLFLILLFAFGAIHLSVTRTERLVGKWESYKMIHEGKTRDFEKGKSKRAPWIEFTENNRVWLGEGDRNQGRGEWWLDDDNKTIHIIVKNRDMEFIIQRLTKERLVMRFKDGRTSTKGFWKKVR